MIATPSIETKKRPSGEGLGRNLDNTISLYKVTLTGTGAGGLSTQTTVNTDNAPQFVVFYTAASGQ